MSALGRLVRMAARFCVAPLLCVLVLAALIVGWRWQNADSLKAGEVLMDRLLASEGPSRQQALAEIVAAAEEASPVALERLIGLLEAQYQTDGRRSRWLPAEEALERLAGSRRPEVSAYARAVFQRCRELRRQRALDEIQRLGGSVRFHPGDGSLLSARLNDQWTGGDAGLSHVRRLADLRLLYLTSNVGVSRAALAELRKARPDLSLLPWGTAYLGIIGRQFPGFFQVESVERDSASDRGGVRPGDILREFDGQPIADFDAVAVRLAAKTPGDRVTVRVSRRQQEVELTLVLGTEPLVDDPANPPGTP